MCDICMIDFQYNEQKVCHWNRNMHVDNYIDYVHHISEISDYQP